MTEINKKFIEAMQKRLDKKDFGYFANTENYKNIEIHRLADSLGCAVGDFWRCFYTKRENEKLLDLANLCWMMWERLEK